MDLHITALLFLLLEQINKIYTQGLPISPCPKIFQYRFDGTEWFGILSVRNMNFQEALHLKVTISIRGKPATSYLGDIELLTRGQFRNDAPALYKVKFPKAHLPPRLLQIIANNQVLCLGTADHSIFVTQIILEHTRKFKFLPNRGGGIVSGNVEMDGFDHINTDVTDDNDDGDGDGDGDGGLPMQLTPGFAIPSAGIMDGSAMGIAGGGDGDEVGGRPVDNVQNDDDGGDSNTNLFHIDDMAAKETDDDDDDDDDGGDGILPSAVQAGTDTKHLPLAVHKNPMRSYQGICGRIDDRVRFQVLHAMTKKEENEKKPTTTTMKKKKKKNPVVRRRMPFMLNTAKNMNVVGGMLPSVMQLPPTQKFEMGNWRVSERDGNEDGIQRDGGVANGIAAYETRWARGANPTMTIPVVTTIDAGGHSGGRSGSSGNSGNSGNSGHSSFAIKQPPPTITRGAWPWMAAIYVNNLTSLSYQCGGTLVGARVVISSAHCFHMFHHRYTANEVLVFLGRHNLKNWNEDGSLAAPVDDIFLHPDYDRHLNTYDADIAVIMLKHQTRFNTFIRPACLWSGSTNPQYIEGELGAVVGWGLANQRQAEEADEDSISGSNPVPHIVSATIISNAACFKADKQFQSLSSNRTFCAGTVTTPSSKFKVNSQQLQVEKMTNATKLVEHARLCTGDSGAGLMIFKNQRWILRGTVSASVPLQTSDGVKSKTTCDELHHYVIYTDVAQFLDWIFAFMI